MAGEFEEIGEGVAEHGAASVADMHRPGRIGRHIFDVDIIAVLRALGASAEIRPLLQRRAQNAAEHLGPQADIDEPRPRHLGLGDVGVLRQRKREFGRELARIGEGSLGLAGVDHGGVAGEIAMRGVARRLDHKAGEIDIARQPPRLDDLLQNQSDALVKFGVKIHG